MSNYSKIELVWPGKTDAVYTNKHEFKMLERVGEGPYNKLIYGDNRKILASLQDEINLIYIDPPYNTGKDWKNKEGITCYSDKWGGEATFLSMIYERLKLMYDLMAEDGSIYVHCDWRLTSQLRQVLGDVFGESNFQREIIWSIETSSGFKSIANNWIRSHDNIIFYGKSSSINFTKQFLALDDKTIRRYDKTDENGKKYKVYYKKDKTERRVYFDSSNGRPITSVWNDIIGFQTINNTGEYINYPTQKPEALLERIIKASSNPGDLVADFFCGSGTTMAVAEQLGRKWIGVDSSPIAIETSKQRLLQLGASFEVLEIVNE